jgi:histidinol-phosphate aminotransferase
LKPMNIRVPEYILNISPYVPGKPIDELEREYGIADSIKLASNENPLGPSPEAVKAMGREIARVHRYPDGSAHVLLNKLAAKLQVQPAQIVIGNGSDDIIAMLGRALLRPGDEVIIPTPTFLVYAIVAQSAGAVIVRVPLKDMGIDLAGILERVTSKTRLIFICNPNNPTGTTVTQAAFGDFLKALPPGVVVVLDEAYIEFVRDSGCARGLSFLDGEPPVVTLRTFSKVYGLAGLRIGYGVMARQMAAVLHRVRLPFNVNSLAQAAAAAALDDVAFVRQTTDLIHAGLDFCYAELEKRKLRYFPTQSNFLLIDVQRDAREVFELFLQQGVIVRAMGAYGFPTYIRVNMGLPEENRRFIATLDRVLALDGITSTAPQTQRALLITIDGPAGAGKTTVSRALARALEYRYIDTGALYRAIALAADDQGIGADDDQALESLCRGLTLDFKAQDHDLRLILNGRDVSDRIRSPRISMLASAVSARPVVRRFLLEIQRVLGSAKSAVCEGRDMGTVVFPQADVKFFLDADPTVRARRRYEELKAKNQQAPSLETVEQDMARRDENDSTRRLAPLKPAADAIRIDSSAMRVDEVVALMLEHIAGY